MPEGRGESVPQRVLIVLPSWVGDVVMATPTLRAIRGLYPAAQITALVKDALRPLLDPCGWIDRYATVRKPRPRNKGKHDARRTGPVALARRLAARNFDLAILLSNSFRTALLVRMAGVPRRVGYERDGRGFLLTDRLIPRRAAGRYIPTPTRDYYLGAARYLGAAEADPAMQLFTRPEDDAAAESLLQRAGYDGQRPLVLVNPGANYGEAKMWFPQRFAAVADQCTEEFGATVGLTGAPNERPILDKVLAAAKRPMLDLSRHGLNLALLKSVIKRSRLLVTNDTGPRHIAAAMGVPVVTVFGPTDPTWTEIGFDRERIVRVPVYCSPCQKKRCPLRGSTEELQCMDLVGVDLVMQHVRDLVRPHALQSSGAGP